MTPFFLAYWLGFLFVSVISLHVSSRGTSHPGVVLVGSIVLGFLWPLLVFFVLATLFAKVVVSAMSRG